uniref:tRNA(Ile2) 2-agmatinylcytidine synthetase n=1 Tax=uncultured marine group II/III euryarchaeote KM3_141_C05 TaxID=1457876 RepID=A0A075GHI4_9EURY|nr:tRNA(ile2) 2-agmatinylcytidine synthetase [uncultured marine group II/III euryarchaeote KM3_141_C05]
MGWIGLDDTDSPEGGCTTWDMHLLLTHLEENGFRLVGAPRLVRLWPHAPRRTRGNAALSAEIVPIELGVEEGRTGEQRVQNQEGLNQEKKLVTILEQWFNQRFQHLHQITHPDDGTTPSPTLVWSREKLPVDWYWSAVREWVEPALLLAALDELEGTQVWSVGRTDGVVGASSAIAWPADRDWTWEATAWRMAENIGSERKVPSESVAEMAELFSGTILNRDPNAGRSLIAPRTPCPVLYGIRAEDEQSANSAHEWLQSQKSVEKCVAKRTHKSNQATGDHLLSDNSGVTISPVTDRKGGHASVEVYDGNSQLVLVAFSEGGEVNELLRTCQPGDRLSWRGTVAPDCSIHLENLRLDDAVPRIENRPKCECGSRFRRKGRGQPLTCAVCSNESHSFWLGSIIHGEGTWVEPPISQRRHLAMPLNREPKV